jgi:hypothetical protein
MGALIFFAKRTSENAIRHYKPDSTCVVAIDVGLRRSGCIGGAAGSLTLSLPKTFHLRSVSSAA